MHETRNKKCFVVVVIVIVRVSLFAQKNKTSDNDNDDDDMEILGIHRDIEQQKKQFTNESRDLWVRKGERQKRYS